MITATEFKKQIAKPFGEEMRKHRLKGTGFDYFTDTEDFLIAVYIEPSRWGGSCTAGFAIHPKQIHSDSNGTIDLQNLKIYQYEFKMGLTKSARAESWKYKDDATANLDTLQQIISSIKGKAFPVIEQFKSTPNILEEFDVTEMEDFHNNWTKRTNVSIATTATRFAWAMTVIFEHKNHPKAKQFAKWGLAHLTADDGNWFGKKDFDRIATKYNGA